MTIPKLSRQHIRAQRVPMLDMFHPLYIRYCRREEGLENYLPNATKVVSIAMMDISLFA